VLTRSCASSPRSSRRPRSSTAPHPGHHHARVHAADVAGAVTRLSPSSPRGTSSFALTFTLTTTTHRTGRHRCDERRSAPRACRGAHHGRIGIVTLPLVILVLAFQRRIVSGLTAGGSRGNAWPPTTIHRRCADLHLAHRHRQAIRQAHGPRGRQPRDQDRRVLRVRRPQGPGARSYMWVKQDRCAVVCARILESAGWTQDRFVVREMLTWETSSSQEREALARKQSYPSLHLNSMFLFRDDKTYPYISHRKRRNIASVLHSPHQKDGRSILPFSLAWPAAPAFHHKHSWCPVAPSTWTAITRALACSIHQALPVPACRPD